MKFLKFQYSLAILLGLFTFKTSEATTAKDFILLAMNPQKPDSTRFNAFTQYYVQFHQQTPDSVLVYSKYHLKLAQKVNNKNEQFKAYLELGNILRLQKKYDLALTEYQKAKKIAFETNQTKLKADALHNIGTVWVFQKEYTRAMNHYYQALDYYEIINDRSYIKTVLSSMASVFLLIRNHEMAIEQYKYILKLQEKDNIENITTGIVFSNLGWAYFKQSNFAEAESHYLKALSIHEKNAKLFMVMSACMDLSRIYLAINKPELAVKFITRSIQLAKDLHDDEGLNESILIKGKIIFRENPQSALQEILPLQEKINQFGNLDLKKEIYELFYLCYKHLGNSNQALYMHEQYQRYNDSVQNLHFQFEIVQESIKRAHQKQLDAAKLAHQKKVDALKIKQLKVNFSFIGGSLFLLGILLWIIKRNKNLHTQKRAELLKQIEELKQSQTKEMLLNPISLELNRTAIETAINRKLNETDWKVLNILFEDASISNQGIADKAYLSVDGIGSSLRRMYDYFDIKESKYKKINLITEAIKISKNSEA